MPFGDFDVFWNAARAMLQGRDPYAVPGVYYPLPTFFMFLPLATIPLPLAHVLWTAIQAIIFVAILRRRAVYVVLFMPVLLSFLMGQTVIPLLGVFALLRSGLFGGVALALLMLKPQLVGLLAPWQLWQWWNGDRRQIAWFILVLGAMGMAAFLAQPDWVSRWLAVSGERLRAPISPSIWGVLSVLPAPWWLISAGLVTVGVVVWAWRRNDIDLVMAATMLVNPLLISYDLTFFTVMIRDARTWIVLTVLSWIVFGLSALELNERSVVLLSLFSLATLLFTQRKRHRSVPQRRES
jgi:hypothetical protein